MRSKYWELYAFVNSSQIAVLDAILDCLEMENGKWVIVMVVAVAVESGGKIEMEMGEIARAD